MSAHLRGRQEALEAFGLTGREAEWIALACFHGGGLFTRAQLSAYLDLDPRRALRFVRSLAERHLAVEWRLEDWRVCRIGATGVYRALGDRGPRPHPRATPAVEMRRLLSLDYVLEHGGVPWIATEAEKVDAFGALGIEPHLLPSRRWRGAVGDTPHYFPLHQPLALEAERAVFVHVDPGYRTIGPLRAWGKARCGLWKELRRRGRSVDVVAVVRTRRRERAARAALANWARKEGMRAPPFPQPGGAAGHEIARIERAILEGDDGVLGEYGDLQAGIERIVELKERHRTAKRGPWIDGFSTWRSNRLPGEGF